MSQVYLSTKSTPTVPTSFITDDGTAVPVLNNLNLIGGSTTVNDSDGLRIIGSGNTATVQITNRLFGTGSTVNAVTDDLVSFSLGGSVAVYNFRFQVVGRDTGTGNGVGYNVSATFKTDGVTATRINTPWSEDDEAGTLEDASVDIVASSNNVIVRVTGVAGQTISWVTEGSYIVV